MFSTGVEICVVSDIQLQVCLHLCQRYEDLLPELSIVAQFGGIGIKQVL